MSRRTKKSGGPIPSLTQEVSHFDVWWHFSQIHAYFENYLVLELKHHSLHTHSVSSSCLEDEKLLKSFGYVIPGGHDGGPFFSFAVKHQVFITSTYNFPSTPKCTYM